MRGQRAAGDRGAALVEFVLLVPVLLVPLVYVLLVVFQVQAASYAVTSAAREAGRAFVTSTAADDPWARAGAGAGIALRDHHLTLDPEALSVDCSTNPCGPGAVVRARLSVTVGLPLLPRSILGHRAATVTVSADHQELVDRFRAAPGQELR